MSQVWPEKVWVATLLPAAVYLCDASGLIKWYNSRAVELWGREPDPASTDERFCGSYKIYHPDGTFIPHWETPIAELLRTGIPVRNRELIVEYYRKEGRQKIDHRVAMAERLGIPLNALRSRAQRVRDKLERCIMRRLKDHNLRPTWKRTPPE